MLSNLNVDVRGQVTVSVPKMRTLMLPNKFFVHKGGAEEAKRSRGISSM